eukprot:3235624-Rhodomonas_salina.2
MGSMVSDLNKALKAAARVFACIDTVSRTFPCLIGPGCASSCASLAAVFVVARLGVAVGVATHRLSAKHMRWKRS